MERTNGLLQVIRTRYIASQDEARPLVWRPWLGMYGDMQEEDIALIENHYPTVLEYILFNSTNGASAFNNIIRSRENARAIQDHITKEVWQCLNDYYHFIRNDELVKEVNLGDPVSVIDLLIKFGLLFTGTVDNTMTRGEGFTWMHIGKFLERTIHSADILRLQLNEYNKSPHSAEETAGLRYLLYSLYGFEVFVKTYQGELTERNVRELIIYNPDFPHSIMYSITRLFKYFKRLEPESLPENYAQLDFLIGRTMNNIRYSNVQDSDPVALELFLNQVRIDLSAIAASFSKHYFGN